ncbi:Bacteroides conjugative transposon TraK protein [Chryseobacterium taklimakanense]|uniref:Bacteroides conjugative transposon TraK protein n=1 Tax=Chryseobacterium taklimakanense TaxID=536441 RepID=A0A239XXG2_9FLAO|nr:conjugative transposon protein TraK [Chryseobacterium taklimakanense]SNV51112.1 Bacteroides conjugative transposon TraK protein [Chryseobacterium taklimakanense]
MLIKSIEEKIRINKAVSITALTVSLFMVLAGFGFAYQLIKESRKSLYVLDNGVPVLVKQTDELLNRPVEYRSQVELFHRLFFTLAPDDQYIKDNIEKSLYLIDDTGKKEYTNLREKGFYNQLISSNSMVTVTTDSIQINSNERKFMYFGKQMINRKTALIVRKLFTEGRFEDIVRSPNNPHGVLLKDWRIIDNSEISNQPKFSY